MLAEDMFEDVLKPAIFPKAQDLIDEARRAGCRIVLITGALDFTIAPLARHLRADDIIANKMQFVGGVRDRQGDPADHRGREQGERHPRVLREAPAAAGPELRLLGQLQRLRDAGDGGPAHRGESRHAAPRRSPERTTGRCWTSASSTDAGS